MELFVKNIEQIKEFYCNILGFSSPEEINKNYISLRKDDVILGLGNIKDLPESHPLKVADGQKSGLGVEIVLEVEDIRGVYKQVVETGYPIHSELVRRPWGLEDFRIIDPDGYYLRITSSNE